MSDEKLQFVPYNVMVNQLFKPMNDPNNQFAGMMHAAIGIAGEAKELLAVESHKNFLEEAGDLEFYIEAAWQQMERQVKLQIDIGEFKPKGLFDAMMNMVKIAGDLIDTAKKSWVYQKEQQTLMLHALLTAAEVNLAFLYECFATTGEQVRYLNQYKLIGPNGRFRSGFYSDDAAQKRADKANELTPAERSFIGQVK